MRPRLAQCAGVFVLVVLCAGVLRGRAAEPAGAPPTPEGTVTAYLQALKAGDFAAAYDTISKAMSQGKPRDAWAKEQQWTMQMSDAKIFDYHVYPGTIAGDKAYVPDVLSSQDKFLNQLGVPEYELYILVREAGRWKIDQQRIVEKSEQSKWFPPKAQEK